MNYRTSLLTATAAAALVGTATAQVTPGPNDFQFNWANMASTQSVFTTGPGLFNAQLAGQGYTGTNYAGVGDSIRCCYGIDSSQGGRNQGGTSEVTWFEVFQGHAATTALVDVGLVSIRSTTVDSLDGDACISAFFAQGNDTGTGNPITAVDTVGFAAVIGGIAGTAAGGGTFWNVIFEFIGSTGVLLNNTTTAGDPLGLDTLLAHVIYEIQGPLNGGVADNQYYLASTAENLGVSTIASGGVTNGNNRQGQSLFGLGYTAEITGAISHNRISSNDPAFGFTSGTTVTFNGADKDHWVGSIAFRTPFLFGANNGGTGGGGSDWVISVAPTSTINLRVVDHLSGGEGGTLSGAATLSAVDNPGLALNAAFFVWSCTPAALLLQEPMSWDTTFGFASAGSQLLGPQVTSRAGAQTIPANFDVCTSTFFKINVFFAGTDFSGSLDGGLDGDNGPGFDVGQGLTGSGMSTMKSSAVTLGAANPGAEGTKLGIAAVGVQFDLGTFSLSLSEVASALTINLQ